MYSEMRFHKNKDTDDGRGVAMHTDKGYEKRENYPTIYNARRKFQTGNTVVVASYTMVAVRCTGNSYHPPVQGVYSHIWSTPPPPYKLLYCIFIRHLPDRDSFSYIPTQCIRNKGHLRQYSASIKWLWFSPVHFSSR
ncbi:hypothetical protein J6590_001945 [Homalodisca vitripennis]|nr:hypothetical protein J6590_001945 [Homalodisca vitripennis]